MVPNGNSHRPGFFTRPEKPISLVPASLLFEMFWYHSTPLARIAGTLHNVSTLFTQVGLPHTPEVAGKGGLERGFARRPSRELISAVSSPQM
ncbi:Uncharacterised protein [Salmonella enterica subsp. enterica serovar Bovismorbificans]|uniref:Uncharacterized protein n=1 Tax=Salmonella enterica subsp. enterica serovar Bovismorbificans TaxID=58097 RepID=A0A655DWE4_SALET|nr:Uncharacterised protein [Salmonella enterica subsp. enterica serovar Bovismorbificans]